MVVDKQCSMVYNKGRRARMEAKGEEWQGQISDMKSQSLLRGAAG